MHYIDYIFLLALFVVQPVYGATSVKKLSAEVAAGNELNRISLFNETMAMQWIALLVLGIAWAVLARPIGDLGFRSLNFQELMIGLGSMVILSAVLLYSWHYIRNLSAVEKSGQKEELGDLFHYLPQTNAEFRYSILVSITAGVVEEIVYRGFVIWILSLHFSIWVAAVLSSVGFGMAHAYQGPGGVIKTGLVGLALACLYVLTGSIWFPILAHAVMDILQLATIQELSTKSVPRETEPMSD